MKRSDGIEHLKSGDTWDIIIIGGGATGLGCAIDAVSRGYKTLLVEQADFGNATSTRSTKLIHGGVRYLAQGNVSLVRESLAERGWLLKHVPHLVQPLPFLIPTFSWWETWYYRIGLGVYDLLAGNLRIHSAECFSKARALERVPYLKSDGLAGGVVYWDGQFDDARLCIQSAQTVWDHGGLALNYVKVSKLIKEDGDVVGTELVDKMTNESISVRGKTIIQATGIFSDTLRTEDAAGATPIIRASRGSHIVIDGEFLPRGTAVMVPKTSDGRLLFLVPWLGKVIVGTTDVPDDNICLEPRTSQEEIDFILENAAPYLTKPIERSDIRSVFSGLRPLVRDPKKQGNTSAISRNHVIEVSESKLITIAGGKWTTFRKMGQDAIDKAIEVGGLENKPSQSESLHLHGFSDNLSMIDPHYLSYGSDSEQLKAWTRENPLLAENIHGRLPYTWAEVLWAIRNEMAESVEDVLARRTRSLFLDSEAAVEAAPSVTAFMANELDRNEEWEKSSIESFNSMAESYRIQL